MRIHQILYYFILAGLILTAPSGVEEGAQGVAKCGTGPFGKYPLVLNLTGRSTMKKPEMPHAMHDEHLCYLVNMGCIKSNFEYYKELFRLRGWKFPELPADQRKRPILVGKITNDVVYDRLAPGVRQELHRLTPRDDKGRLKHRLFQRLTEDVGHPKLREHLASVVALMKASDTWQLFKGMLDRALPRYGDTPYLPFDD